MVVDSCEGGDGRVEEALGDTSSPFAVMAASVYMWTPTFRTNRRLHSRQSTSEPIDNDPRAASGWFPNYSKMGTLNAEVHRRLAYPCATGWPSENSGPRKGDERA
jgi:hypothetical protein